MTVRLFWFFSSKEIQQSADTGYRLDTEDPAALTDHCQHSEVEGVARRRVAPTLEPAGNRSCPRTTSTPLWEPRSSSHGGPGALSGVGGQGGKPARMAKSTRMAAPRGQGFCPSLSSL